MILTVLGIGLLVAAAIAVKFRRLKEELYWS